MLNLENYFHEWQISEIGCPEYYEMSQLPWHNGIFCVVRWTMWLRTSRAKYLRGCGMPQVS